MPDCVIVGGGVIGLSLAFELAGRGASVRVFDRGQPGREASWAGAGILPPANTATATHPYDRLRALSHQLHPQWAATLREESGVDTGYRECGGLYLARSAGEAASLRALAEMLGDLQIAIEPVPIASLAGLEPALAPLAESGGLQAAYSLPDEAQLRNPDHLHALLVAAERRGVVVEGGAAVSEFEIAGGRVLAAATTAGRREADAFCIASGAWTHALLKQLDVPTGILPVRGQMAMFRCPRKPFERVLNEGPRYLVPRDDGRVLVGSTEEEAGFDKSTTDEAIGELVGLACELVPQLADAPVEKTWAGLRPGSFDGFPYLGRLPGLDNAFAAAGHFRSGLQMSTGTAVVMAQLMLGEEPQIDLSPFRVGR